MVDERSKSSCERDYQFHLDIAEQDRTHLGEAARRDRGGTRRRSANGCFGSSIHTREKRSSSLRQGWATPDSKRPRSSGGAAT